MKSSADSTTRILRAVADPARRKILLALKEKDACSLDKHEGLCARDIEQRLDLSQPTISHHMAVLQKAGLVEAKKIGQWMWYRRHEAGLRGFLRQLQVEL